MRTQSPDIEPEVERVQIEMLRKMTVAERAELTFALSQEAIDKCRNDIKQMNPNASEDELKVLFVEATYGKQLADRIREELAKRASKKRE